MIDIINSHEWGIVTPGEHLRLACVTPHSFGGEVQRNAVFGGFGVRTAVVLGRFATTRVLATRVQTQPEIRPRERASITVRGLEINMFTEVLELSFNEFFIDHSN